MKILNLILEVQEHSYNETIRLCEVKTKTS